MKHIIYVFTALLSFSDDTHNAFCLSTNTKKPKFNLIMSVSLKVLSLMCMKSSDKENLISNSYGLNSKSIPEKRTPH